MKKLFFFLAAMVLSIAAQAAVVNIDPSASEEGNLRRAIRDNVQDGDTLVLADGEYKESQSVTLDKKGLVIMAADGAKPVIKAASYMKHYATTTVIGISFDGGGTAEHGFYSYDNTNKSLTLIDCEVANYKNYLLTSSGSAHVDSVVIDGCLLHDCGDAAVYYQAATLENKVPVCSYFKMTNSTVYNINGTQYYGAIDIRENKSAYATASTKVIIDHVTLYNYATPQGGIYVYKSADLAISNTIVANPTKVDYSLYIYGGTVDNTLYFNGAADKRGAYTGCIVEEDPLFVDAANGDFNLQPGSPAIGAATDGTNLGDPRWKVAAAELSFAMAAPAADVEATDLYTIKWNVLDPAGDATIKLEYKTEEGEWTLIEENIPTTKSAYDWNIRKMAAQTVAIRGTLTNATETIESVAAGKLTIVPEAVAPRPVRNLAGEVAENTLTLTWINPDQAYEISAAIETFEVGSYESYLSGGGTSTITVSDDKSTLTSTYEASSWAHAGIKISMEMGALETISMDLQGDASANKIVVILEQAGPYWWYTEVDGLGTEWTTKSFTINDFEPYPYNNKPVVETFDGLNITSLRVASNLNKTTSGLFSVKNIAAEGIVPAVADYAKTVVCASTTDYPAAIVASEVVYEGTASTCALTIDPTEDYYVSVFAQDDLGNTSVAAQYMYEAPEVVEPEKPEPTYTENNLNPYAFGLESKLSADKETLTVTYRLNNSNATSVNVLVYNGEEVIATVPGTTTIGKNTVAIPTTDFPGGVALTWSVEVNGKSVAAPTREEKIYSFFHPSSVDVDNNPENPTFGMLLVNEAMQKVKTSTKPYVSVGFGAGIFAFTPSFDLLPNGELPGYNGGIDFTTGRYDDSSATAYAPRRIRISDDGRIFVTSLNTDGNYLWEVNPENMNEWTPIFKGTRNDKAELVDAESNFIAAPNVGFDVKGSGENLQLLMLSSNLNGFGFAFSGYQTHEYNLGTATEWTTTPSKKVFGGKYVISYTSAQVEYDNEGGVWICQNRSTATDAQPSLIHINAAGEEDYKEVLNSRANAGIRFNHDFSKLIIATSGKKATIYAVSKDANDAPVLTEEVVIDMSAVGTNLNDFAYDYAGNLYACGNSSEKLAAWAMPYSGKVETPAASKYAFQLEAAVVEPVELVGVVKRALTIGESTVVLTHEADSTAHIYNIVGEEIAEISLEGVVPVDPENKGSYLAISDIAVTEDGKLVANNYVRNQFAGTTPEAGYKVGTSYYYIWNDLAAAPAVWFTTQTTARSSHGDVGISFALKGTSTNAQVLTTAVHNNNRAVRLTKYNIIDGQYVEPNILGGEQSNDYYEYYGLHTTAAYYKEATQGKQFQLSVSPLGDNNWIMDGELVDPSEFVLPAVGEAYEASAVLTEDLGKKYNGASYVTVGEQVLMVAPYATAEGLLAGVKVLDITAGLASATEVAVADLDAAVEATAAATAVVVDEDKLIITLVGDATLYTLTAELTQDPGPGTALDNIAVEAKAIKMIKNGQLIIIKNGVQYNVQGQVIK